MPEPSLALQKALRARLVASSDLTALVPAENVIDATNRPLRFPCIKLGEGVSAFAAPYVRYHDKASLDVHVYVQEEGLMISKEIVGAIVKAIRGTFPNSAEYRFFSVIPTGSRFMRDPSGQHSHAVLSIEALLQEVAA